MRPQKGEAPDAPTSEASENLNSNCSREAFLDEHGRVHRSGNSIVTPATPQQARQLVEGVRMQAARSAPDTSTSGETPAREREYLEMCKTDSGELIDLEYFAKRKEDRAKLLDQSNHIADKLEAHGIKARGEANMYMVGLCSGEVVELPDFRNIVFIPFIAARKRAPMLRHLEFFMSKHTFCRMWVFTTGTRTPLDKVRPTLSLLHRRLSKLNAEPFMKEAGIQIVFRSSELGSLDRDENGKPTFHIHAHTIVNLSRKLSKERWKAVLSSLHRWWKAHVKDAQRIHQAREACKYLVKPQDLLKLDGAELKELYEQTFRMHLVQPMGMLKEQIQSVKDSGKRLVRKRGEDGPIWSLSTDWNSFKKGKKPKEPVKHEGPLRSWVTATTQPAPILSPISEPVAVVMNYSPQALDAKARIKRAREAAKEAFQRGQTALKIKTMKKKRTVPTSRHNRKSALPILTLDEELELAESGVICSGLSDLSRMGGPRRAYFTILHLGNGAFVTLRHDDPKELLLSVEIMQEIVEEENDVSEFMDYGDELDFRRN